MALAVVVSVYWSTAAPRPYAVVDSPRPDYAMTIPEAPLNANLSSAIRSGWWLGSEAWPSEQTYRLLSRRYWLAGTQFTDIFYLPVVWPDRLDLTANNLSLDPSGQYLVVPFQVRLQISDGDLWVYAVLYGLTQNPFEDDCGCSLNHTSPYAFGMLIREQQYQLTWFLHLQSFHNGVMVYDPSLSDAYSTAVYASNTGAFDFGGLSPIVVDHQTVYATGSSGIEEAPIPPTSGYAPGGWPIDPSIGRGLSMVLSNSTIFVFDLPLSILPHTATDLVFDAMFLLEVWPPLGADATSQALDYKPGSAAIRDIPSGPDGWNNTAAYLPFWAPLPT